MAATAPLSAAAAAAAAAAARCELRWRWLDEAMAAAALSLLTAYNLWYYGAFGIDPSPLTKTLLRLV